MADYGSDRSEEAAVSDGSGSEADLGTDKPMEKTKYLGPDSFAREWAHRLNIVFDELHAYALCNAM